MPQDEHDRDRGRIINVRKLAALDIALHGAPLIVGEFAVAVVIGAALGIWLILAGLPVGHSASALGLALGAYPPVRGAQLRAAAALCRRHRAAQERTPGSGRGVSPRKTDTPRAGMARNRCCSSYRWSSPFWRSCKSAGSQTSCSGAPADEGG